MSGIQAAEAYPLSWPVGVKRTEPHRRQRAKFGAMKQVEGRSWKSKQDRSVNACVRELQLQVNRMGGKAMVISTNIKLRLDGLPYSNPPKIQDPGAAVYFTRNNVPYCFPCDRWDSVEDNLWAIAKHLDAMRGMERWGVGTAEQQFLGYKALTAVAGEGEDPWMVLGMEPMGGNLSRPAAEAEVLAAHRKLARTAHPDAGGTVDQMARINVARDAALAALKAEAR